MKEQLLQRIEDYKKEGEVIWKDVEAYLKDTSIDVNDRWEVFTKTDHRDIDGVYAEPDGINWKTTTYYDDFHTDRGVTILATEMLETGLENGVIENEEAFKEWWLQSGYRGCDNDW